MAIKVLKNKNKNCNLWKCLRSSDRQAPSNKPIASIFFLFYPLKVVICRSITMLMIVRHALSFSLKFTRTGNKIFRWALLGYQLTELAVFCRLYHFVNWPGSHDILSCNFNIFCDNIIKEDSVLARDMLKAIFFARFSGHAKIIQCQ